MNKENKVTSTTKDEDEDEETIIDLSKYTTIEACHWLLYSLNSIAFSHLAYTIPFCTYAMSWYKAVPIQAILILQSPYPRNIFPPIAAAMSYDTELCKNMMEGREMPPTVQVLANDLYINGGMEKEDTIAIIKNGWALVEKGILLVNEAVFHTYNREESYIEAAKQCSVLIRLLQETEKYGKRTVNIYAFGEVGEKVGSNLCSWYKSSILTLTKRKVTHPAGVARRFSDLNDPNCHMGTPSFSKSLVKCLRNHVAFMHTMSKNSEKEIKYRQQQDTLDAIEKHFLTIEPSLQKFHDLQKQVMEAEITGKEHKALIEKLRLATDDLATRFRITNSIVNNYQARSGSVSNNVSKSAPSMKSQAPSESLLQQHTGQELSPAVPIAVVPMKIKPIKGKRDIGSPKINSTPVDTSSFTEITSPPSVTSVNTATSGLTQSSQLKIKPKKPFITPIKNKTTSTTTTPSKLASTVSESVKSTPDTKEKHKADNEERDTLSPLANKFKAKMKMPQPKSKDSGKKSTIEKSSSQANSMSLTEEHRHALSCVEAVVEAHKGTLDEDDEQYLEDIQNDMKAKTIYNNIVQRLVDSINEDIDTIPDFDFIKWITDASTPCATFNTCKEEFNF